MKSYQEFLDYIKDNIKNYLPEKYADLSPEIDTYPKSNVRMLDGLTFPEHIENHISPIIYLNDLYENYRDGAPLSMILSHIAERQTQFDEPQTPPFRTDLADFLSSEEAKKHVVMRVCNYEKNENLLADIPFKAKQDLALCYSLVLSCDDSGIYSQRITNDVMHRMNLTPEELHRLAAENTPQFFPPTFRNVLDYITQNDVNYLTDSILSPDDLRILISEFPDQTFILSNIISENGAASLFYPDMLEKLSELFQDNFYALPSSIHEFVIIPAYDDVTPDSLLEIVVEANTTELPPEDFLATNVYYYDRDSKELSAHISCEKAPSKEKEKTSVLEKLQNAKETVKDSLPKSEPGMSKNHKDAPAL